MRDETAADRIDRANRNADVLAYLSKANGRFGAISGTLGVVPTNPFAPIFLAASKGSELAGWGLGGLEQAVRPNPKSYGIGVAVDLGARQLTGKIPEGAMLFNEIGDYIKSRYAN
jgi:filamentous hemagglutinin